MKELETGTNTHFKALVEQYKTTLPLLKEGKKNKLISRIDVLADSEEGVEVIYENIPELIKAGILEKTVWESPKHLVPSLIGGTLLSGYPNSVYELLSELRLLAISEGRLKIKGYRPEDAKDFLKTAIVENFDLAFEDFAHPRWSTYQASEIQKIEVLFSFLLKKVPLDSLKEKLLEEIKTLTAHRPIVTSKVEQILEAVYDNFRLNEKDTLDSQMLEFTEILFRYKGYNFESLFSKWSSRKIKMECQHCGKVMKATGLISQFHLALLKHVAEENPELLTDGLALNSHGISEFQRHQEEVIHVINEYITPANKQSVYGLSMVLRHSLLSRKMIYHALERLKNIKVHPDVAERLMLGNLTNYKATPKQLLMGGIYSMLGQPLGVRQGNNPTCQSARALSMWSRHYPGKLINLLIDAASADNVIFRYEGQLIESANVISGVAEKIDYKLDYISIVLVPLLDKIYNEMMTKAIADYPGTDPHISVNPAFYGHWINTGFKSVYDPILRSIVKYDEFVSIFYASYHPDYNGGNALANPVPLGIFITNTSGSMQGFHAISMTRVQKDPEGKWRSYFFNPNSEGPQNWGQGIRPSVAGNEELAGESSLPFSQFVSRVYAYHYNQIRLQDRQLKVPQRVIDTVKKMAKDSWGTSYFWL